MKSQRYLPTCKVWKSTHLGGLKSRALAIYMARQTGRLTVCKWKTKSTYGKFRSWIMCIICTNEIHVSKRGICKSRKQVFMMSIEQIEGEFPFGTFVWKNRTTCTFFRRSVASERCTFQATRPESVGKWKGHVSLPPHWKHEHVAQYIRPSLSNSKDSCLSLFFMLIVAIHLMDNGWKPKLNP